MSCGENVKEEETVTPAAEHHEDLEVEPLQEEVFVDDMMYAVPTPNELFNIIRECGVGFDASIMNPVDKVQLYDNKRSQALNFGVYSADLAYSSSFKNLVEAKNYFGAIRRIGDALGIMGAFDNDIMHRVEGNLDDAESDSLLVLSNETYYKAYNYLEENDRGGVLAMIVVGGWIEGLYIMTNLSEYEEGSALVSRIGEQKMVLDNLLGFLAKYSQDEDVIETQDALNDIFELFFGMEISEGDEVSTQKEGDVFVFSGGSDIVVTEEQFNELKAMVAELRTEIVEGNL